MDSHIVIIGAGIIGLTIALRVQDYVHKHSLPLQILVVAREFPTPASAGTASINYASMHAGAHVRPIPAHTPQLAREARWLKHTCQVFASQAMRQPWLGVSEVPAIEYLESPSQEYFTWDRETFQGETGLKGFRKLTELPEGVKMGFEYKSYCINSPVYCQALLRKFILQGGQIHTGEVQCEDEAFGLAQDVKVVVNASGVGFGDKECFPTRGQIALTNIPATKTITRQNADGTWNFIIPRGFFGGTVVGGTKEPYDWDTNANLDTTASLMASVKKLGQVSSACVQPRPQDAAVLKNIVARRPTRKGGVRLEVERRSGGLNGDKEMTVVHAYGAGGRGYELSWGIAEEARSLVEQLLAEDGVLRSRL